MSAPAKKMATVHRPNDYGIDLPAGSSADELDPRDYHPVEMNDAIIERAAIHRPGECGIDLPAGKSASDLTPADYRIVEMEEDEEEEERKP